MIDAKSELLAAVSYTKWTATDPADDPLCKKCVQVSYKGKTIKVPIKEKCMVCEADHVELSLTAFKQLEKPDAGRATGATVNIVECGGSPPKTSLAGHTPATSTPADDASLRTTEQSVTAPHDMECTSVDDLVESASKDPTVWKRFAHFVHAIGGDPKARLFCQLGGIALLAVPLSISFSRKIDSFAMKIFCWNCCFVNGAFTLFLATRYLLLGFYYKAPDICCYDRGVLATCPEEIPTVWNPTYSFADDLSTWPIYSMALTFLVLRYTTLRACVSPLSFQNFSKRWWIIAVVVADLLPCVAITAATITLFDVEMNSFVRSSCVFAFVGAVWLVESVLSALSLLAACRYALQRKTRPANKASNIVCLVTFRFFSVIPCLQMVPSAYDSALLFVQELARQTYSDCLRNSNASTEDDLARHIRCESAAIGMDYINAFSAAAPIAVFQFCGYIKT
ncbi:expansin B, partial [Aphelenchoides avenae]